MNIDKVYHRIGGFGTFQQKAFALYLIGSVYYGTQIVINIFAGVLPTNQTCAEPPGIDACDVNCTKLQFNDYDGYHSYSVEWNMTCGTGPTEVRSVQSILMAGFMFGAFPFGPLGDKYGRFKLIIVCHVFYVLCASLSSFANNYAVYATLRFLTGFFNAGQTLPWGVLMAEYLEAGQRRFLTTITGCAFSAGLCILSATAWLTQDWRLMSALLGFSGFTFLPLLYFWHEESPRWLLNKDPMKCRQVLGRIARVNGYDLPNEPIAEDLHREHNNQGISDLFRHQALIKVTLIQAITWFALSNVYYGLTIAAGEMGSSRYISLILSSLTDIPCYIIALYTVEHKRIGRSLTGSVGLILGGIFCGSVWFVGDEHTAVIIGLACAGKFFNVIGYCGVHLQSNELFPTPLRNAACGLLLIFNRIGGVLAPQIVNLDNIVHNGHFIAFGIIGIVSGLFYLLLPETRGRRLPNHPNEIYGERRHEDEDQQGLLKVGDVDNQNFNVNEIDVHHQDNAVL